MTLKPCDKWDDISSSIETRIEDISIWILNMAKTECIAFRWDPVYKSFQVCKRSKDYIGLYFMNGEPGEFDMYLLLLSNNKWWNMQGLSPTPYNSSTGLWQYIAI